jgi:Ca2+/Na+ antiporter
VGLALATALVILLLGWLRGSSPKLLEYADVIFFAALAVVVAVASPSTHHWLELWSGEIANLALMAIVLGSIAIRRPFTLQYAREEAPREVWNDPHFIRANYVITWVWAAAFIVEALSGLYGDAVLHDSDNLWTGWIIQTLPLIFAVQFTLWYPRRLKALAAERRGESTEPPPPVSVFLAQLTPWLTVIGIVSLAAGAAPTLLGVAFIVAGVTATRALKQDAGPGANRPPEPLAGPGEGA